MDSQILSYHSPHILHLYLSQTAAAKLPKTGSTQIS